MGKSFKKYLSVNFTHNFMQSSFDSYKQKCESLIPYCLFEEKYRKTIYIRILLCQSNEPYVLMFTRKWEGFTREKYYFDIILRTRNISSKSESLTWKKYSLRNIRSLFNLINLKDKSSHVSSVVYEGKCNCGKNCICETGWNVATRWGRT